MHLAGSDIGLSPAARARLTNVENALDDPMELLLGMDGDPAGRLVDIAEVEELATSVTAGRLGGLWTRSRPRAAESTG